MKEAIIGNSKIKAKDLEGGKKTLMKWFGADEDFVNQIIEEKK